MRLTKTLFNQACSTARLVLYKLDASPPSNAVRMVGAILGLQFDYVEPDLLKQEHKSPEFKKMNPMCTIPVLKDGNLTVSESHAIIMYLLNKYGGEHKETLYPSDPATRAIVDQCLFFDVGVLFPQMRAVTQPTFTAKLDGPTKKNISDIEEGYSIVEAYLGHRAYVAADHLTIADISLGSTFSALLWIHPLDPNMFPKSAAWFERLSTESYFKEINAPGVAFLASMLNSAPNPIQARCEPTVQCRPHGRRHIGPSVRLRGARLDQRRAQVARVQEVKPNVHYTGAERWKPHCRRKRPSFAGKSKGPTKNNISDIEEGYAIIEAYLESGTYVAADHLTVADISLGSTTAALQGIHALDANKFPKTKAWLERLSAESYFKEINTPGATLLAKMLKHFWKQSNKE